MTAEELQEFKDETSALRSRVELQGSIGEKVLKRYLKLADKALAVLVAKEQRARVRHRFSMQCSRWDVMDAQFEIQRCANHTGVEVEFDTNHGILRSNINITAEGRREAMEHFITLVSAWVEDPRDQFG